MGTAAAELFDAIRKGDRATIERVTSADPGLAEARADNGVSAVLTAFYYGKRDIAALLLSRGPALDIFEAAAAGDAERARALVDEDPSRANAVAGDGFTPLGLAAFFKRPEVVRLLLDRGADPAMAARNANAFTPLHAAVATDAGPRDIGIVNALLEAGAQMNARSGEGGTPLHTAAFTGDAEVVELLLARGADPRIAGKDGKTAIDIARQRGHAALAERMERG